MQLSAPEPTPRARINWILEEETLGKREVVLKSQGKNIGELGMVWRGELEDGWGDWRKLGEQRVGPF